VETWIIVRQVTPYQMDLAGAAQLALIIRTTTHKTKRTTTRSYFLTSRPAERLDAATWLELRRTQWGIESICHQRLDVSLHEDKSRVRSLSGVAVLGLLARISLALFAKHSQRPQPVRDKTYPVWSGRLLKQPAAMLRLLQHPCLPP